MNHLVAGTLAAVWGVTWAYCLQATTWGRWLVYKRTWITVVIGVGVDLLICRIVLKPEDASKVVSVFGISSLGIIARSLYNELPSHVKEELGYGASE